MVSESSAMPGIEARAEELGKACLPINLDRASRARIIHGMETTVGRVLFFLMSVGVAAFTALFLAYIAHYDFGLSREEIRTPAVAAAVVIAMLMAVEFFGKRLRNPK
jgi:hypothetical protein